VEGEATSMGFSVSMNNGAFEWCSDTLSGLLATASNIINPRFYAMFSDIFRFNKAAHKVLALPENHPARAMTVEEFLKHHRFSEVKLWHS
jgi:predicted NAD/FAD-binding protein